MCNIIHVCEFVYVEQRVCALTSDFHNLPYAMVLTEGLTSNDVMTPQAGLKVAGLARSNAYNWIQKALTSHS